MLVGVGVVGWLVWWVGWWLRWWWLWLWLWWLWVVVCCCVVNYSKRIIIVRGADLSTKKKIVDVRR